MPMQVRGVRRHAMSGTELSCVRTEFRLRLPEPSNKSPLESSGADIGMQSCGIADCHMSSYPLIRHVDCFRVRRTAGINESF
jgi:hypothetical protein